MFRAVIIDDEKWVIRSLLATIKGQEYFDIIGEAYDGISGLELITELKPDLVFTDVCMAGMGGLDMLQAAREVSSQSLFIIISGYAEFAYAQKALLYNAIGNCLKPFSKSELYDAMEKAFHILTNRMTSKLELMKEMNGADDIDSTTETIVVKNKMVQVMLDYIHEHYNENVSIQDLSELCNINQNYASQLFSQELGVNFCTYLTKLRIDKAVKFLKTTDLPVSNIAISVGYRDYFYFAKVFKKATGITPTAYRSLGSENTV